MNDKVFTLYHGSDHKVPKPLFGYGKPDNDYGSGFYTTRDAEKAAEWAASTGTDEAIVNVYEIDTSDLFVVNLDDYGVLTWIAEIVANRGARGENAFILGEKIVEKYRLDLSEADIIVGYRADDSYLDIVDAFLQNQLDLDEVERLFRKGELGLQYFIKSEKAFNTIEYKGFERIDPKEYENLSEVNARTEVAKFLRQRSNQIFLNGFQPTGITARDAANHFYEFNAEYNYYALADGNDDVGNTNRIDVTDSTEYEDDGFDPADD